MIKNWIRQWLFRRQFERLYRWYRSVTLYPQPFTLQANERALVLSPHPDDESIGCGGLLLRYSQQMSVVCLTDGRHGNPGEPSENVIARRRTEFEAAMQKVGIPRYQLLEIPDQTLLKHPTVLEEHLDLNEIDYLFVPNPMDLHKDHRAVVLLLEELLRTKPHKPTLKLAFYEVWSALAMPNAYLDISDLAQTKHDLINIYTSQTRMLDYAGKIAGLNAYRGMYHNLASVETYTVLTLEQFWRLAEQS